VRMSVFVFSERLLSVKFTEESGSKSTSFGELTEFAGGYERLLVWLSTFSELAGNLFGSLPWSSDKMSLSNGSELGMG
jgi:hypothetical protein